MFATVQRSLKRETSMKLILPQFPKPAAASAARSGIALMHRHSRSTPVIANAAKAIPAAPIPCRCPRSGEISKSCKEHRANITSPLNSGRTIAVFFCAQCGTRVWHAPAHSPDQINIKPGTLDDTSWIAPVAHLWTSRMQPGTLIEEEAVCIEGQPGSREPLYEAWAIALSR